MKKNFADPSIAKLHSVAEICMVIPVIISISVLLGYIIEVEFLKRWINGMVEMDPASAILFILAGIALLLVRNEIYTVTAGKISRRIAIIILLIALVKLVTDLADIPIFIDRILFSNALYDPATHKPSEMSPNSAVSFVLLSFAILLIDKENIKGKRPTEFFCIIVFLISLLTIYGYVYGVKSLYGISSFSPISFNSAINFLIYSLAILFCRPHKGSMAMVIGETAGELFYLRVFAIFFPLVLGWFRLKGEDIGLFNREIGTAYFAIATYVVTMVLIGRRSSIQHKLRMERKKTEQIVREDSKRLNSILDNSSALIYIRDLDGKFLLTNSNYLQAFDLELEKTIGKSLYDVFPKKVADLRRSEDKEVIASEKSHSVEEEFNDDEFITIRFPLKDTEGNIYAVCGISSEITQLKEYERELAGKEKRLRAILENIGEGVVVADSDGKFVLFNEAAEEILGLGALEADQKEWAEKYHIFHSDCKTPFPSEELPIITALKGESTDDMELCIKNPEFTEPKKISITSRPIKNEDGTFDSVVVFRDITQSKKLDLAILDQQQKLILERQRLSVIIETINEGVIVADSEEGILVFNNKASEIFGKDALDDLKIMSEQLHIFHPDGITPYPSDELAINRALKGHTTDDLEIYVKNPESEEPFRLKVMGRSIKKKEGAYYAIVVYKDISAKVKLQDSVQRFKNQLKTTLSTVEDGVVIIDKNGKFINSNNKAFNIIGKGNVDIKPSLWPEVYGIYNADDNSIIPWNEFPLSKALNGKTVDNMELRIKIKSDQYKQILVSGQPIYDKNGNVTAAILDFKDITKYKEMEHSLKELRVKHRGLLRQLYSKES